MPKLTEKLFNNFSWISLIFKQKSYAKYKSLPFTSEFTVACLENTSWPVNYYTEGNFPGRFYNQGSNPFTF